MSGDEDIKVSVYCLAYNHGRFIKDALEGFVKQKTNFRYEVFVHDDASTDNTADIIREYADRYPDTIKPIFQTENQYSKKVGIVKTYIFPKMKGKYIAVCEGDDFWIDENKLQIQYDILEANPECAICFCRVACVDAQGEGTGVFLPSESRFHQGILDKTDYYSSIVFPEPFRFMAFQLSGSMFHKKFYERFTENKPDFVRKFDVGDIPLFLYMGMAGEVYFIDKSMSCYRTGHGGGFGAMLTKAGKEIEHREREISGLEAFDQCTEGLVHDAVTKGIQNQRFWIYRKKHDYPAIKSDEMKYFYDLLTPKERVKEYIYYHFPWCEKLWAKLKTFNTNFWRRWTA